MTTEVLPEYGLFAVDKQARTVRGILLPWGQRSRMSASKTPPITFPRGSVKIPRDPSVVGLNRMHDRFDWVGRADQLEDADVGIVATFRIADTDEGDAWLQDHGALVKLSPEVKNIVRNADDTGTADLTGAALVDEGAFAAAALFAIDRSDVVAEVRATAADAAASFAADVDVIGDAVDVARQALDVIDAQLEDEEDDASAPADADNPATQDEQEGSFAMEATVPNGLGRRTAPTAGPKLTKAGFFAAMNTLRRTGDRTALLPYLQESVQADGTGLFALSNVTFDDAAGLVENAGHPGAWLGQLWQGKRFTRRIVPLLTQGSLTAMSATGWVWGVKPAMAAWSGNKTPVPSNAPTVSPKTFPAVRFAGGHDLAREYYDFGVTDVIDSYGDAMIDSYAELSDAYALTQVVAGALPYTPDPANTVNTGLLDIVDGALAVVAAGGTPSWAVVAPDIFKGILATPHEDALDYFAATVGLEGGTLGGGANFSIVPDARLTAGAIIVGDKGGATAWELPGVPIRVSAPDLQLGGIDNAFFGYIGVGVTNPNVVVKNTGTIGTTEGLLVDGVEDALIVAAEKSRGK